MTMSRRPERNLSGWWLLGLAACLLMSACAHPPVQGGAEPTATPAPYIIGESDQLEVMVWQEPDLSRTVTVRSDGLISLPLVGEVRAAGLSAAELQRALTERLAELVADPVVSVIVVEANSASFYITGKVARPGEYALAKQTSVLQAVALAGGFTEWAKRSDLRVIRASGEWLPVDYDEVADGRTKGNVILQRGDTVVVP